MVDKLNLAYKIVSSFDSVTQVEDLVWEVHSYFVHSPQRVSEYQQVPKKIIDGKKLLKDIDTRWISLFRPIERVFKKYKSLTGYMYMNTKVIDRAKDVLYRLQDFETLFTLCGILSILYEVNLLIKLAQERDNYIIDFVLVRKHVCLCIDMLYEIDFFDPLFEDWRVLTNYKDPSNFLRFNIQNHLCIYVNRKEIHLYYFQKRMDIISDEPTQQPITYMNFGMVLHQTKIKLR